MIKHIVHIKKSINKIKVVQCLFNRFFFNLNATVAEFLISRFESVFLASKVAFN